MDFRYSDEEEEEEGGFEAEEHSDEEEELNRRWTSPDDLQNPRRSSSRHNQRDQYDYNYAYDDEDMGFETQDDQPDYGVFGGMSRAGIPVGGGVTDQSDEKPWVRKEWRSLLFRVSTAMGVASFFLATLAAVNAGVYFFLFSQMVPANLYVRVPVFFDFDPNNLGQFGTKLVSTDSISNVGARNAFLPTAQTSFKNAHQQWVRLDLDEGESESYWAEERLVAGFWYDVYLVMRFPPVDEHSKEIGNFMVTCELFSIEGDKSIARSKRPVLARERRRQERGQQDRMASSERHAGWGIWPWSSSTSRPSTSFQGGEEGEETTVQVTLFERMKEHQELSERVGGIRLHLSTPLVQVFDAEVVFECHLFGVVYYMYHWKVTCFLLFMFVCCGVQFAIASFLVGVFSIASAVSLLGVKDQQERTSFYNPESNMGARDSYYGYEDQYEGYAGKRTRRQSRSSRRRKSSRQSQRRGRSRPSQQPRSPMDDLE